jgi:hypothetical protein
MPWIVPHMVLVCAGRDSSVAGAVGAAAAAKAVGVALAGATFV